MEHNKNHKNVRKYRVAKVEEPNISPQRQIVQIRQKNLTSDKLQATVPRKRMHQENALIDSRTKEVLPKSTQTCIFRTKPDSKKQQPAENISQITYRIERPAHRQVEPNGRHRNCVPSKSSLDVDYASLASLPPSLRGVDGVFFENVNYGKHSSLMTFAKMQEGIRRNAVDAGGFESTASGSSTSSSLRTVISGKSGENLRATVLSQIKMQEQLKQTIHNMTQITEHMVENPNPQILEPSLKMGDSLDIEATLATAKDVITCKVMAPIMRRVQRLYYDNLQEKVNILRDMERVPDLVDNIYQTYGQSEPKK